MKSVVITIIFIVSTLFPLLTDIDVFAQDKIAEELYKNMERQRKIFNKNIRDMEAQWEAMVRRMEAQNLQLKRDVEKLWEQFYHSTPKVWVTYSSERDARSKVDFEKGEIELAVLIPKDKNKQMRQQAEKKLETQLKSILSPDRDRQPVVLKDHIRDSEGKSVDKSGVADYIKKYVSPKIQVTKKPVIAKDGIPRQKASVTIKMAPDHIKIRANRYKGLVNRYAEKNGLKPSLVFSIIHTESFFNPYAVSLAPAYGLMQLVPKFGAMDAYEFLYNKKRLLSSDYLYKADNNILLGTTYLHILQNRYLEEIKNKVKRELLSIAAYNWGPTVVLKKIVRGYDIDRMTFEELIKVINRIAPVETRDYVKKVLERVGLYR